MIKKVKGKGMVLMEPSLRAVTCHIWDHTVLPATRHK